MRHQQGFTLIELVVVLILLLVLTVGTTQFIVGTAEGYGATVRRDSLAGSARSAVERMNREVRNALPNSARAANGCLEFVPIVAASNYLDIPLITASSSFSSIPYTEEPTIGRVAVYPIDTAPIYQLSNNSVVTQQPASTAASDLVSLTSAVTVTLAASHTFPAASPFDRYFMVATPVSFCLVGTDLFRYQNYGFIASQPDPALLPAAEPNRQLLAVNMTSATPFQVVPPDLQRNGLVMLDLSVSDQGETLRIQTEVQMRNVP